MLVFTGTVAGQDLATTFAAAEAKGEAGEWVAAVDQLLAVQNLAATDAEQQRLEALLTASGAALRGARDPANALRAFEAALLVADQWRQDEDDPRLLALRNDVATCLGALGRHTEALSLYEQVHASCRRQHGDGDHRSVATSLNNIATCLYSLDRLDEALVRFEAAWQMRQRLFDGDHPDLVASLRNVAHCREALGRAEAALPLHEQAVAMEQRLLGGRDHGPLALAIEDLARCLDSLRRPADAVPHFESSLAMRRRLADQSPGSRLATAYCLERLAACLESLGRFGDALPQHEAALQLHRQRWLHADHRDVARALNNVACCLDSLGRSDAALPQHRAALAMRERIAGRPDDGDVLASRNNLAACLQGLGRTAEALPLYEAAQATARRLFGAEDPRIADTDNNTAACLCLLGRFADALPLFESALAMDRRQPAGEDSPAVALRQNNVAYCLQALGRSGEALALFTESLELYERLHEGRDHRDTALGVCNLAACLMTLDRHGDALLLLQRAAAMYERLHGRNDHPDVARCSNSLATCLRRMGRLDEALQHHEAAVAMGARQYRDRDHAEVALWGANMAVCLSRLGRGKDALSMGELAAGMIERLRDQSRTSGALRQSLFDDLKRGGTFELLPVLYAEAGDHEASLQAVERGRGRGLLDAIDEQSGDPFAEAERRAQQRGDTATKDRLMALRAELADAALACDRALHAWADGGGNTPGVDGEGRRRELLGVAEAATRRHRQLADERARLLGDVLSAGRVCTPAQIRSALREGELLLEFTLAEPTSLLHLVARKSVQVVQLPGADAAVKRWLPGLLRSMSHQQLAVRGRDPEPGEAPPSAEVAARELFTSLIPASVWPQLRASKRVFLAAHRELHHLPFELLVVDVKEGKPVHWLDSGPPIGYVPSGSLLHWLRQRADDAADDTTALDLLAIGDPGDSWARSLRPEHGVLVAKVDAEGEGARVGLEPQDVLVACDGTPLVDDSTLRDVQQSIEAAVASGARRDQSIRIEVWRRGALLSFSVGRGGLGIHIVPGTASRAYEATLDGGQLIAHTTRHGDLERLHRLPPLGGARAETEAIERAFAAQKAKTRRLVGAEATESLVSELAPQAKYLHFACHGIAEDYAGQSLSMLVLSAPKEVGPGDDGLLKLGDLFDAWRGNLSSCRLVVLSACRTNVGPTFRDESPQALPIGFLFAGAPSVISSLWAVDDDSTRVLMVDFYSRLLAGETDKLAAFHAAKKALRATHPDPFHWAPFLYMGSPQ